MKTSVAMRKPLKRRRALRHNHKFLNIKLLSHASRRLKYSLTE